MYFYEVFVSSQRYHGNSALTYSFMDELPIGAVVQVPLQRQAVLGIVAGKVPKPHFPTRQVARIVSPHPLPLQLLELHNWLHQYYPAPLGIITQLFIPSSLSRQARANPPSLQAISARVEIPPLTKEQQKVIEHIYKTDVHNTILLHGDTGTGKTRIYLELVSHAFTQNKSALVMTPEIGLTPQLGETFERAFPGRVVTIHSTLSGGERRDAWLKIIRATGPLIVIGPRSALFSPIRELGLVIIDEAHDAAYKQEQMPYYQTSRVAAKLAKLHNAKFILGTATPLVTDYYTLSKKQLPILRMTQSGLSSRHAEANVKIVNLREPTAFSRSPWISDELIQATNRALQSSQQSLFFLNRRGSARLVLCQICAWQALCPRCDLPLTYHGDKHEVRCHTCGYQKFAPTACEKCNSTDIVFRSIGTKSLAAEVQKLFPKAKIARYDSDNTTLERLDKQYEAIKAGAIDIIIGTQMLTKGLDLPHLAVVGVIAADTTLYFPDYTAEERTFQMLTQVAGRVGRGHQAGTVIVQTYHPESLTVRAALQKDYTSFYEQQLREREQYHFPPYCYTLKLVCDRASARSARQAATKLTNELRSQNLLIEVVGPAPSFTERVNNRYFWQIVVKSSQRTELLKAISLLPANWSYDLDPTNLL